MRFAYAYTEKGHGDYAYSEQPRSVDGKGPKAGHLLTRRFFFFCFFHLLFFFSLLFFFPLDYVIRAPVDPSPGFSCHAFVSVSRPQQGKMQST